MCMGGTVQIVIAENRQLAVPGWCTVAPVHGERIEMCVAAVRGGGLLGEDAISCSALLICACMCVHKQAHMFFL